MSPSNSIMVIAPYVAEGTWVFDDDRVDLVREPFVAGVPEMIDHVVAHIPGARKGFRLTFSARPFPGHTHSVVRLREESGGYWYRLEQAPMEGWLCPALFKYFEEAPAQIYLRADPKG